MHIWTIRTYPPSSIMVIAQCAGCAREGAWTKKCGRCKKTVYCSPECQRSHWKAHKAECYAAAPLVVTEKPGPSPPPPKKKRVFLLTDGLLRVAYLEGCSKAGGLAHDAPIVSRIYQVRRRRSRPITAEVALRARST